MLIKKDNKNRSKLFPKNTCKTFTKKLLLLLRTTQHIIQHILYRIQYTEVDNRNIRLKWLLFRSEADITFPTTTETYADLLSVWKAFNFTWLQHFLKSTLGKLVAAVTAPRVHDTVGRVNRTVNKRPILLFHHLKEAIDYRINKVF